MSKTLTAFREGFAPKYEDIIEKSLIGMKLGNTRLESDLSWGKKVKRAILILSDTKVRDVVRYVDRTMGTIGDKDEYIEIDKQKAVDFKFDAWDKLQNGPLKAGEVAGKQCALKLRRYIDADIFYEVVNAFATFSASDVGGTAGEGITLTTTNLAQVIADLQAKLLSHDIEQAGDLAIVVDPYVASIINQTIIGKDIQLTDLTLKNGYAGPLLGFKLYISNNLTFTGKLAFATNPTANDTVTVAGFVFKFVASIGTTAGNVLIGADAAASKANLIAAINGGEGAGTTYIDFTAEDDFGYTNRDKLYNLRVTATSTTAGLDLVAIGASRITCSETLTAAGDVWSKKMIHCFAGRLKSIDIVVQQDVKPDIRKEPRQKTVNVLTDALYGIKTFLDGKQNFLDFQIAVS